MPDCTKRFLDLTPGESIRCFFQADAWQKAGDNLQRMWADFTSTTIGEWVDIFFGLAFAPAMFAAYLLPPYFCWLALSRYVGGVTFVADDTGRQWQIFWASYMIATGLGLILFERLSSHDRFILIFGAWIAFCGVAIFLLGPSWWGERSDPLQRP